MTEIKCNNYINNFLEQARDLMKGQKEKLGLTIDELEIRGDLSHGLYSKFVNRLQIPRIDTFLKMCYALGIKIEISKREDV